jgi:hypothetical protein
LQLLARAISGRSLEVKTQPLANGLGFLSGGTLVVDTELTARSRRQVVIQTAMLAEGSFDQRIMRSLLGKGRTTARYCALEGARAVRARNALVPGSVLREVLAVDAIPATESPDQSRRLADRTRIPEAPDFFGQIKPLQMLIGGNAAPLGGRTSDAGGGVERDGEEDSEDESEESSILNAFNTPMPGINLLVRMLRSIFDASSAPGSPSDTGESGSNVEWAASVVPGATRYGGLVGKLASSVRIAPNPGDACYPEWDEARNVYRPDWVTVHEFDPYNPDGFRDPIVLGLQPSAALRRSLALGTMAPAPAGRALDGDTLHPDGVVDLARWRRLGSGAPPLLYRGSRRIKPDVAVLVLLDASGSTRDEAADQVPVFDSHLALSYRLVAALDALGVPVGLYAFQTWDRSMVRFLRGKSFTERVGQLTRHRLGQLEPAGNTRIGGAVRHATAVLERSAPGTKRVLVLISDGLPYDEGYEAGQAAADTRAAMAEARGVGIGCVCVGVTAPSSTGLSAERDALAGASALHVAEVADIERRLGGLIRQALADARRRGDHLLTAFG